MQWRTVIFHWLGKWTPLSCSFLITPAKVWNVWTSQRKALSSLSTLAITKAQKKISAGSTSQLTLFTSVFVNEQCPSHWKLVRVSSAELPSKLTPPAVCPRCLIQEAKVLPVKKEYKQERHNTFNKRQIFQILHTCQLPCLCLTHQD